MSRSPDPVELDRCRFIGYVVAAPTLAVAVRLGGDLLAPEAAAAATPTPDGPAEIFDLGDLQNLAAASTAKPPRPAPICPEAWP